jgi:hypothetical protein
VDGLHEVTRRVRFQYRGSSRWEVNIGLQRAMTTYATTAANAATGPRSAARKNMMRRPKLMWPKVKRRSNLFS